jgi:hypothetical protein
MGGTHNAVMSSSEYLSQARRDFNNIEDGFYISPAFLDKLVSDADRVMCYRTSGLLFDLSIRKALLMHCAPFHSLEDYSRCKEFHGLAKDQGPTHSGYLGRKGTGQDLPGENDVGKH